MILGISRTRRQGLILVIQLLVTIAMIVCLVLRVILGIRLINMIRLGLESFESLALGLDTLECLALGLHYLEQTPKTCSHVSHYAKSSNQFYLFHVVYMF